MNEKDWIYNTNIYEVNLRQYTVEGTFLAFSRHLPRLRDMGVETLWFMPVTPISFSKMKGSMGSYYACSDYTSVNPEFGSFQEFKWLVEEAHALGFRVIMDWVANHTGWDHVWTVSHPDWYKKDDDGNFRAASGMDDIIELDFSVAEMRKAMIDAMRFWVEKCGIDGFRCDLAYWVEADFWKEAKHSLEKIRPLFWLAEADPLDNPEYMEVFDAAYTWRWMHKTRKFFHEHLPLDELSKILGQYQHAPGIKLWFTTNHDENSWNGTEFEKYGDMASCLAVVASTWPGIPLIYSGQEIPNTRRLLFFDKDPIDWEPGVRLHMFYQRLLRLRNSSAALRADSPVYRVHTTHDLNVMSYLRKGGEEEVLVILNFSGSAVQLHIRDSWLSGPFVNVDNQEVLEISKQTIFELGPWESRVMIR